MVTIGLESKNLFLNIRDSHDLVADYNERQSIYIVDNDDVTKAVGLVVTNGETVGGNACITKYGIPDQVEEVVQNTQTEVFRSTLFRELCLYFS